MGLSRAVSEIDGDFGGKSQNFPTPVYIAPPLKGFVPFYSQKVMSVENRKFTYFPQPRLFNVRPNVGFAWNLVNA